MKPLDWLNLYNEFSRSSCLQAKDSGIIFKVIPDIKTISLKILDSYTGVQLKELKFENQNKAINYAEHVNTHLYYGRKLDEILRRQ